MLLFKKAADLHSHLEKVRHEGISIGFVPTMGALHEGHLSLIRQAKQATGCCVCSIFVNPTQFNDPSDLEKYPRTPERDMELLLSEGCDVLFMPPVEEVYPPGKNPSVPVELGFLDKPMEGAHRPGHFTGVAQVVSRLLDLVQPDNLYLGQKDFQQAAIVREMLEQTQSPVKLVVCATVREADGLAMSSRNVRLTPEQRAKAPLIYQTLLEAKQKLPSQSPRQIEEAAMKNLSSDGMLPEYFEVVDGKTLRSVEAFESVDFVVACTAVKLGDVRLIDNLILKNG
ncbi:MAG: pantoate--beta-alanine ligase [Bacteroidota bacterium]